MMFTVSANNQPNDQPACRALQLVAAPTCSCDRGVVYRATLRNDRSVRVLFCGSPGAPPLCHISGLGVE